MEGLLKDAIVCSESNFLIDSYDVVETEIVTELGEQFVILPSIW